MDQHPDFEDVAWPRQFPLGDYEMTPLSPEFAEEDFDAVMATGDLLKGLFGPWPEGLTLEENRIDLAWHEREFTANRSFSWIIRDAAGTYLGCFYLYPAIGARGAAKAALWLCDTTERLATATALKGLLQTWLAENLPPGLEVAWITSPVLE